MGSVESLMQPLLLLPVGHPSPKLGQALLSPMQPGHLKAVSGGGRSGDLEGQGGELGWQHFYPWDVENTRK